MTTGDDKPASGDGNGRHRRDFLQVAAGTFVGVGACFAIWPLIEQGRPNPGSPKPELPEVDLSKIAPGGTATVTWQSEPVVIRHRTLDEIKAAKAQDPNTFVDTSARNAALPPTALAHDDNRHLPGHPEWLVVVGLCTHMGCKLRVTDPAQENGVAWFCPCHAARYDIAGRLKSGPAQTNLPVPLYRFTSPTTMEIGAA
ncbi:MAG: ubiquinol-cytochrome c reductase iron-sulfur subunit [Proteobacteria bacterium]|nr:ubiquinol-cytochrome c reductase iron-sulfur subunit [Pseudomonadota bacterium]